VVCPETIVAFPRWSQWHWSQRASVSVLIQRRQELSLIPAPTNQGMNALNQTLNVLLMFFLSFFLFLIHSF